MIEIEGTVVSIVYRNDENGYTVAKVKHGRDTDSVVGYMPFLSEGQKAKFCGEWTIHKTFGQQLKVESFEEIMPATLEGVEKYLSSGLIKGIGPATAKRIVEKFGMDSLDIIEMNPGRLTEIEGIGEKRAQSIAEAFKEQRELREVLVSLQSYGISVTYGLKIYKRYGKETFNIIKENPYKLCDDISGIGFKTADRIARNLGVDLNSTYRIMAGIKYILSGCIANGHVYLPKLTLYDECVKLLNVPIEIIEEALISLMTSKQVICDDIEGETAVYLSSLFYSELGVARRLVEFSLQKIGEDFKDIEDDIKEYEKLNNIEFATEQKEAVIESVKNGVCIITGGPGTGKTTIIKCIIEIFKKRGMEVVLAAPTGRASKRITEATGYEAKTIHRLLEMEYTSEDSFPVFTKDEADPLECDAVIIDEASMVDILLMNSLLKAMPQGCRLIMVGDVDQLPSVGPGNVLRDIIDSHAISVVRLNRIYRQADESLIAVNAHRINSGDMPILNDREKDFFFIQKGNSQDMVEEIVRLVDSRIPSFKEGFDPMRDIQVLSPTRKGEVGIYNLNIKLQEVLNPKSSKKGEKQFRDFTFRVGDKVMQIKNNYSLKWQSISNESESGMGIFNGDIGFVESVDSENQNLTVIFDDDKRVVYDFSNLDELEMAYAVTIHKSQGCEFPVVIIPVFFGPPMLLTRNLIYTGVTRAKKLVVLVGVRAALSNMINNNTIAQRYTGLKKRILAMVNAIR
ncbi:ATP-dependent DNA helicase, RecD/TraA family [Caloramator quimbayensis]|uniref:ATP-dependent RecD2 DNA helicase n=1 Tax=Caloramator quimbayensis TaxID=1147123 RepID=A0A1T4WE16_9CLOT|nr:ATP-dependent RecD-like DNA helicase [Caloramator quimbayensis]SKA75530.1 ATP-dependent DNA helicase, RecD/TraA family [Caloramator quimbayensis]